MRKTLTLYVFLLLIISCSLPDKVNLSEKYVLNHKYLRGEMSFYDKNQYSLHVEMGLSYLGSTGTYLTKGDTVLLTSNWQPDSVFVSSYKIDSLKLLNIAIEDFDNIPLEGKVILDKKFEYDFKNGHLKIDKKEWDELWVLNYNYINKKVDTLVLMNSNHNSFLIRKLNTFNYSYNYLFLNKTPLILKGKKLLSLPDSPIEAKQLKFIAKKGQHFHQTLNF